MKAKRLLFICIPLILLMMTQCKSPGNYPKELDKLVPEASLIFKGKVLLLHTSTTDEDDVSKTGVVAVTEVIDAPESLKEITGQQITVRFADINSVKEGDERMFFTKPYLFGETLGVEEIGSLLNNDKLYMNKDISKYVQQARTAEGDKKMKAFLKESPLVVSGKVVNVDTIGTDVHGLTEHDPEWQMAEIQVDEMIKGELNTKTVKVLFPASKDVMFYQAPKLNVGDEGVFIIQKPDDKTIRLFKSDKMINNPSGYIRGKENATRIKSLLK